MSVNHIMNLYRFASARCGQKLAIKGTPEISLPRGNLMCPWTQIFKNQSIDEGLLDDFKETGIETHPKHDISLKSGDEQSEYNGGKHDRDEDLAEASGDAKAKASGMVKDATEIDPDNDDGPNAQHTKRVKTKL